jgi:hypothetical protein
MARNMPSGIFAVGSIVRYPQKLKSESQVTKMNVRLLELLRTVLTTGFATAAAKVLGSANPA